MKANAVVPMMTHLCVPDDGGRSLDKLLIFRDPKGDNHMQITRKLPNFRTNSYSRSPALNYSSPIQGKEGVEWRRMDSLGPEYLYPISRLTLPLIWSRLEHGGGGGGIS